MHVGLHIEVDPEVTVAEGHQVSEAVQHALFHALPRLIEISVHLDPWGPGQADFHQTTLHHRETIPLAAPG